MSKTGHWVVYEKRPSAAMAFSRHQIPRAGESHRIKAVDHVFYSQRPLIPVGARQQFVHGPNAELRKDQVSARCHSAFLIYWRARMDWHSRKRILGISRPTELAHCSG